MLGNVGLGAALAVRQIASTAFVQHRAPDEMRGRLLAILYLNIGVAQVFAFPIALAGTVANVFYGWGEPGLPDYSLGYIYLPALLIIVAASVTMAPLGARTAHRMPVRRLQKVFAVILYTLATYMFWKAFQ